MKKTSLSLVAMVFAINFSYAQNTFPSSGNVGIGTTTPSVALHVVKTAEQLRLGYDASNYSSFTTSSTGGLTVQNVATTTGTSQMIMQANGNFFIDPSNNVPRLSVGSTSGGTAIGLFASLPNSAPANGLAVSGNVGIGTSSPASKLYLAAGGRNGLMIDGSLDGTPTSKYLSIWQGAGGVGIDPIGTGLIYLGYDQASDIYFGHSSVNAGNGFWKADGTVGIGTTSSSGLLTIGSSSNRGTLNLIGSSSNPPALSISDSRTGAHQYTFYNGVSAVGNLDIYDQTAGAYRLTINSSGNVLIGQATQVNTAYKLDVAGPVRANEIVVNTSGADFVFEPTYKLPSISSLERYIKDNHHLPEIPSAKQMQQDGLSVGENQVKLLQKVEELTLYLIEKDKQIKEQQAINQSQTTQLSFQQQEIDELKKQVSTLIKPKP